MRLLCKNTGEIVEGHIYFTGDGKIAVSYMSYRHSNGSCSLYITYDSISEFIENFETIADKEPLIKDEKNRKAVRAWAEANNRDLFSVKNEHFKNISIVAE